MFWCFDIICLLNLLILFFLIGIILKNLPKRDFEEQEIKDAILSILTEKYSEKEMKKKKLLNKVLLERESERMDGHGNYRSRVNKEKII